MTKTIAKANLPNIKLEIDPITESMQVSRLSQVRRSESTNMANSSVEIPLNGESKAFTSGGTGGANWNWTYFKSLQETKSFSSSPQTSDLGSGQALDITPSYYTTHMWLRTS